MKYLLFFLFYTSLLTLRAETALVQKILVEKGDVLTYPSDLKPVKIEAFMNGWFYACAIMPGDFFEITSILNYQGNSRSEMSIKKIGGAPGDQKICPIGSLIDHGLQGTYEKIRTTKLGDFPRVVNKLFYPFIFVSENLERVQERKNYPKLENITLSNSETIMFLREDSIIKYPLNAPFRKVIITSFFSSFHCTVAPGDSFKVVHIIESLQKGGASVSLEKTERTSEEHGICPKKSEITIDIIPCELIKTKEGVPEGVNCKLSFGKLFNSVDKGDFNNEEILKIPSYDPVNAPLDDSLDW